MKPAIGHFFTWNDPEKRGVVETIQSQETLSLVRAGLKSHKLHWWTKRAHADMAARGKVAIICGAVSLPEPGMPHLERSCEDCGRPIFMSPHAEDLARNHFAPSAGAIGILSLCEPCARDHSCGREVRHNLDAAGVPEAILEMLRMAAFPAPSSSSELPPDVAAAVERGNQIMESIEKQRRDLSHPWDGFAHVALQQLLGARLHHHLGEIGREYGAAPKLDPADILELCNTAAMIADDMTLRRRDALARIEELLRGE